MATTTTQMAATTTPSDWTLQAGATKVAAVAAPDDGNTSFLRSPGSANNEQWFTAAPDVAAGSTITDVAVRARTWRGGAEDANFVIGYEFTPQGGGVQSGTSGTFTAVGMQENYIYTHSGLSAVWGSGLKVWIKNTQARAVSMTTLEITITYTPPSGVSHVISRTARVRLASKVGGGLA